MTEDVREFDR
jgi:hypothetical protein